MANRRRSRGLVLAGILTATSAATSLADDPALSSAYTGYVGLFGQGVALLGDDAPLLWTDPPITPQDAAGLQAAPEEEPALHEVRAGDSLWRLSERFCGDGSGWRRLHEANRDVLEDPSELQPGQMLRIECDGELEPAPTGTSTAGADISRVGGGSFSSPLAAGSYWISSRFGPREAPKTKGGRRGSSDHKGIDLAAPRGTDVTAAAGGVVMVAGWVSGYGWTVYIRHDNGWVTRYGHLMSRPRVRVGERVVAGQHIGDVGNSGNSGGNHLHFETRRPDGTAVDPAPSIAA